MQISFHISLIFTRLRRTAALWLYPEANDERNAALRLANTDHLTGLANKRALDLALPGAEADPLWAVAVFDADRFKAINDEVGHEVGDYVLCRMAALIKEVAAGHGYGERTFRYGGDEFVVIAPEAIVRQLVVEVEMRGRALASDLGFPQLGITGGVGRTFAEADGFLRFQKKDQKGMQASA